MKDEIISRLLGSALGAAIVIAGLSAAGVRMVDTTHPEVRYSVSFRLMSTAAASPVVVARENMD